MKSLDLILVGHARRMALTGQDGDISLSRGRGLDGRREYAKHNGIVIRVKAVIMP